MKQQGNAAQRINKENEHEKMRQNMFTSLAWNGWIPPYAQTHK